MRKAVNPLFIGAKHLTTNGRQIKHVALIKHFGSLSINKTTDEKADFIGLDLETNHLTGELKLLGLWTDEGYNHFTENFLGVIYSYIKMSIYDQKFLVWWNKLDSYVILKQFLLYHSDKKIIARALEHYGKISADWNKQSADWTVKPVISVEINGVEFGIYHAIRSSIQFFIKKGDDVKKIWAYDVAQMYQAGLEKEAKGRFDWYSKVDQSAHLVDWQRFEKDDHYKNEIVLKSNMLDAKAVHALAYQVLDDFHGAFGAYPRSLISQGSLARSALIAQLKNDGLDPNAEAKQISLNTHTDSIAIQLGNAGLKDFLSLITEAYSAGYIEAIRFGSAKKGAYADIASAFPATVVELFDLRGAQYIKGTGEPHRPKHGYCFIRGKITVPESVIFNPITIKHPLNHTTNIRASGTYLASYILEERDLLIEQGATFENEEWYAIETQGELSPLAKTARSFLALRKKFIAEKNTAQYMAKVAVNSLYGILFECVDTYEEIGEDVKKAGYRAGEFFNPIYATYITAKTRILLSRASIGVEKNGGKIVALMTDSITWNGTPDQLPKEFWKEEKTLGFFEKPEAIKNIVCLGSGRYGFESPSGEHTSRQRGLNAVEELNWKKLLNEAESETHKLKVRALISVGILLGNHEFNYKDLGRIVELDREIELIVGLTKRPLKQNLNIKKMRTHLMDTEAFHIPEYMFGSNDMTLPDLRAEMAKMPYIMRKEKSNMLANKRSKKYYDKNADVIRSKRNARYRRKQNG